MTLIRMTPDLVYDQMVGLGMAKKLIFSYARNRRARRAAGASNDVHRVGQGIAIALEGV